jgi:hypothetical protein
MRRLGWITSASLLLGSCVTASEPTVVGPRYVHPPTIVVATRGPIEVVQPWLASLRRAKTATISAELANQPMIPELEKEQRRLVGLEKTEPSRYAKRDGEAELADICAGARTSTAAGALDEIVVIRVFVDRQHDQKCIENKYVGPGVGAVIAGAEPGARICVRWKYRGTTVTKFVMAERVIASTCQPIDMRELASIRSQSTRGAGVEYGLADSAAAVSAVDDAAANEIVDTRLAELGQSFAWDVFCPEFVGERRDGRGPLPHCARKQRR